MFISIVLPAFNEEENIEYIYNEIIRVLPGYENFLEIIFIDDGSRDATFDKIRQLSGSDERVRGVRLSRNFGAQAAMMAGLAEAKGDVVVIMDADGQHPPSVIHDMISEYEKGFDIVNTRRESNMDAGWFKQFTLRLFARIINYLSDVDMDFEYSDFRLMDRKAVDAFLQIDEQNRFMRGLVSWMGYRQSSVSYVAAERNAGSTKWTLRALFRLGINGITSFSSKPLRLAVHLGLLALLFGIVYSIYTVVVFFTGR
ncbi:MAG TPA: glycosyltransferase family 2 protein, partial [Bacteroidales bacterium]|nr:glycosyltransferase family 2 protein [Bacteroidales bacterium]